MGGMGGLPPHKGSTTSNEWEYTRALSVPRPAPLAVCLRGGNCNNGAKCGARYLNANNAASRANWNIGGSLPYPFTFTEALRLQQCGCISTAHAEN